MPDTAIYARISDDVLGTEKGVTRQLEDARNLAKANGWEVAGEYVDNDISALTGGAKRTAYVRLIAECDAGRIKRIIIWQMSRLWRNRAERGAAIDSLGRLRINLVAVIGPSLDLATASGRMLAGLLGEFDSMESEVKSERQVRAAQQRAESGVAAAFVPYGWRREYHVNDSGQRTGFTDHEDPIEAGIVREIIDRLLGAVSLNAIIRDLNARGVPSPRRKPGFLWSFPGVRNVVLRPANVGLRVHQGEIIGAGAYPAIVERDKWDRVVALLTAPERHQHRDGRRHHLLTMGVGECGVCGGALSWRRTHYTGRGPGQGAYICKGRGCVQRLAEDIDQLVSDTIIARLALPDARSIFDRGEEAQPSRDRAEAVRARMDLAADQYADGKIDASQLARITARLRPELIEAETEAARWRTSLVPPQVEELYGSDAAQAWASWDVTAKRALLEAMGVRVRVMPQRRTPFDKANILITFGSSLS